MVSIPSDGSAASAGSSSAGSKRKAPSELGPGLKELQAAQAARDMKELLESLYAVGQLVEVRGTEEGFFGSWYGARILESCEARGALRLRVCYLAFEEDDGSFCEDWVDYANVRPMPPMRSIVASLLAGLKKGAPLEIFIEDGWWEVEYVRRDGDNYLAAARRYQVEHSVPLEQLRPAWKWVEQERGWAVHERLPPPLSKGGAKAAPKGGGGSGGGGGKKKR